MIAWKDLFPTIERFKRDWRRDKCATAMLDDGTCHGYARAVDDDEPCEVCKACDRLSRDQGIGKKDWE